jgi:hypothetical protein
MPVDVVAGGAVEVLVDVVCRESSRCPVDVVIVGG